MDAHGKFISEMRAVDIDAPPLVFYSSVCRRIVEFRDYERSIDALKNLKVSSSNQPLKQLALAGIAYNQNPQKGIPLLLHAKSEMPQEYYKQLTKGDLNGLRTFQPLISPFDYKARIKTPTYEFIGSKPSGYKLCFFASSDSKYILKYVKNLCGTFSENRRDAQCMIINVMNPAAELLRVLERLSPLLKQEHIYFSVSYNCDAVRHYYACHRFLILPKMMEEFAMNFYLVDMDVTFLEQAKDLCTYNRKADLILRLTDVCFPWNHIGANRMFFRNNEFGYFYASNIAKFIKHNYSAKLNQWYIDQNATEYAYLHYVKPLEDKYNIVNMRFASAIRKSISTNKSLFKPSKLSNCFETELKPLVEHLEVKNKLFTNPFA